MSTPEANLHVHSGGCSEFLSSLRTHWNNWWNRGTAKAYRKLTWAMKSDPMYALSWQCNIAMPIYDGAKGKLTFEEANRIADILMKHLFDVPNNQGNEVLRRSAGEEAA